MSKICKFNIGTELRMGFGAALSHVMSEQPAEFDRIKILGQTEEALVALTRPILRALKP
jgi:fructose-bisphosphate aldolase class II